MARSRIGRRISRRDFSICTVLTIAAGITSLAQLRGDPSAQNASITT